MHNVPFHQCNRGWSRIVFCFLARTGKTREKSHWTRSELGLNSKTVAKRANFRALHIRVLLIDTRRFQTVLRCKEFSQGSYSPYSVAHQRVKAVYILPHVKEMRCYVLNLVNKNDRCIFSAIDTGILGKRKSEFSLQKSNLWPSDYYFLSQICWDGPRNVGSQDWLAELGETTLRRGREAREGLYYWTVFSSLAVKCPNLTYFCRTVLFGCFITELHI